MLTFIAMASPSVMFLSIAIMESIVRFTLSITFITSLKTCVLWLSVTEQLLNLEVLTVQETSIQSPIKFASGWMKYDPWEFWATGMHGEAFVIVDESGFINVHETVPNLASMGFLTFIRVFITELNV